MSYLKQLLREAEDAIIDTQFIDNTVSEGVRERKELREKMLDIVRRAYEVGTRRTKATQSG